MMTQPIENEYGVQGGVLYVVLDMSTSAKYKFIKKELSKQVYNL
jgi:hypothetical protein